MESVLETPRRKSGLRRRGHLLKALRYLANDPKARPAQRLEACRMLFALETDPAFQTEAQHANFNPHGDLAALLSECHTGNESRGLPSQ